MTSAADPTSDVEPPAIGGLLRLAWRAHRDRLYARLVEHHPELTRAQFELFRWPGMDGMRPTEVADFAGLSKQAVNDTLGELERLGYVERHPHPSDGRARVVRLTASGRALQRLAHETSAALEAVWAEVVGPERIAALRATLTDMIAAPGAPDPP